MIEPLAYHSQNRRQFDYTAYDMLTNLAFGAALGDGLHTRKGWLQFRQMSIR